MNFNEGDFLIFNQNICHIIKMMLLIIIHMIVNVEHVDENPVFN